MIKKLLTGIALFCCASSANAQNVQGGGGGGLASITFPQTVGGVTNSGGIPYLSDTTHISSSDTLAANAIVVGGGASGIPATATTGLNVLTTLAAAVNAANGIVSPTPAAAGDIIFWNGSSWVKLAGNNSGTQYLSESSAGVPSWTASTTAGVTSVSFTCPPSGQSTGDVTVDNKIVPLSKTGNYTSTTNDCAAALKFTLTTGSTYTLPSPSTGFYISALTNAPSSTNILTVYTPSGSLCSGSCNQTYSLSIGKTISFYSDGTNYYISDSSNVSLPPINVGYISGKWNPSAVNFVGGAGAAFGAGVIHCSPYIVSPPGITAKAIGVYVTTADAINYLSVSIYTNNVLGRPDTLIDSIGTTGLNISAIGNLSGLLANGTDFLAPGAYWTCMVSNSATAVVQGTGLGISATVGADTIGFALNASSTGRTGYICTGGLTGCGPAWTAGSGSSYIWPTILSPTWGSNTNGSQAPAVALQVN